MLAESSGRHMAGARRFRYGHLRSVQQFYCIGIMLFAPGPHAAFSVIGQPQPLAFRISADEYFGMVYSQTGPEARRVQSELPGDLRYGAGDIFDVVAGRDGLLVFGLSGGLLSLPAVRFFVIFALLMRITTR